MAFIIIDEDTKGLGDALAYSIHPSLKIGSTSAWSGDHELALQFARREDAQRFADTFISLMKSKGVVPYVKR